MEAAERAKRALAGPCYGDIPNGRDHRHSVGFCRLRALIRVDQATVQRLDGRLELADAGAAPVQRETARAKPAIDAAEAFLAGRLSPALQYLLYKASQVCSDEWSGRLFASPAARP